MFEIKDGSEVTNGSFGQILIDDIDLRIVNHVMVFLPTTDEDKGKGFIKVYTINQELQKLIINKQKEGHKFKLKLKIDDPDCKPQSILKLSEVEFHGIPLIGFKAGHIGIDLFPFTFKEYKYV